MLPWSVVWTAASAVLASLHRGCACLRYATVGMVPPPVSLRFRCAWGEVKWVEVMPVALASAGSLGPVLVYLLGAPRAPHADPGPGWVLSSVSPGGGADAGEVVLAADSTRGEQGLPGHNRRRDTGLHQDSNHLLRAPATGRQPSGGHAPAGNRPAGGGARLKETVEQPQEANESGVSAAARARPGRRGGAEVVS